MGEFGFKESDWKLFRRKIVEWQEAYIAQLNRKYVQILSREGSSAENFWEVERRMRKDRRKVGVECDMRRSTMVRNIVSLIDEGAITLDDLQEFSDELRGHDQAHRPHHLPAHFARTSTQLRKNGSYNSSTSET